MGKVVSHMTMSLDGFVADPDDGVAELFGWYDAGTGGPDRGVQHTLEKAGFTVARIAGSHHIMRHPDGRLHMEEPWP